jgi:hypothetical protein
MRTTTVIAAFFGVFLLGAGAFAISAALDSPRTLMSRGDYDRERGAIEDQARAVLVQCRDTDRQAREVCRTQARADRRVRMAELDARYFGTVEARAKVRLARARARFDVAKAMCAGRSGTRRLECLSSARSEMARSKAGAKLAAT